MRSTDGLALGVLLIILIGFDFVNAQSSASLSSDFTKADSMAAACKNYPIRDLKLLSANLTANLQTEEQKFRAIYKWICDNIKNDYSLYLKSRRERSKLRTPEETRQWNRAFTKKVFRILQEKKSTVCTGYAYLLRELCLHAGIDCRIVNGYGRTAVANVEGTPDANHTWNSVKLNGNWYLCDATWSSGDVNAGDGQFKKHFKEGYFLADPELFVKNHYPLDSAWILLRDKPTLQQFINAPLVYPDIFDYRITNFYPRTFTITAQPGKPVTFRFTQKGGKPISNTQLVIKRGGEFSAEVASIYIESGQFCIDHTFGVKGEHLVHILLNGAYAVTYKVMVE
jgi:hypothetical protein